MGTVRARPAVGESDACARGSDTSGRASRCPDRVHAPLLTRTEEGQGRRGGLRVELHGEDLDESPSPRGAPVSQLIVAVGVKTTWHPCISHSSLSCGDWCLLILRCWESVPICLKSAEDLTVGEVLHPRRIQTSF